MQEVYDQSLGGGGVFMLVPWSVAAALPQEDVMDLCVAEPPP